MRPPPPARQRPAARTAFTLIELLVAMAVLVLLTVSVGQLMSSATSVTTGNRKRLDADAEARVVFDRLALDFEKMLKRTDVSYLFAKVPGGSDKMFFYSEAPAFYDPSAQGASAALASSVALAGYRVNAAFQLERLGKRLSWDGAPGTSAPGGVVFLSQPAGGGGTSYAPDNASTLAGAWPGTFGTSPEYDDGSDDDYHAVGEQVFRLEFCYQLQDGNYSTVPVLNSAAAANNLTATTAPTFSDDSTKYQVGSRWYDHTGNCAYVCTNNTMNAAVWRYAGMQDVRAIVVAIAVLDATSARIVPPGGAVNIGTAQAPHQVQAPLLTTLAQDFADAPMPTANTGEAGSTGATTEPYFPPTGSTQPPAQPARLMAEAWGNELKVLLAGGNPPISKAALGQVRIYQRYFVVNTNAAASK